MRGVLIDENLPAKIGQILSEVGLLTVHVEELGQLASTDMLIWKFALANDLAVITKDSDFLDLAVLSGDGRVVLLAVGNLRLRELCDFVRENAVSISRFVFKGSHPALVLTRSEQEPGET